ncbi:hypothetical protein HMPREF0345_0681 [Enterococcus faecalis ATCC 29200]|uniref:hypothetical protein n=7 Tax=Enterococcus faecalis TaxID=1351 RepID=UPI00019F69BE|nr:hypothetical protein [Enterococcus faecalis]EEN72431.1 hypothetical protein HMPREF0345_0681 [Enterococcus faecalis ATCC 29200]
MGIFTNFSDFLEERRKKKHDKIRKKAEAMKRQGKSPVKKGWGTMVDTGSGGINKNPIDRVYDIGQQQKNLSSKSDEKNKFSEYQKIKKRKLKIFFSLFFGIKLIILLD